MKKTLLFVAVATLFAFSCQKENNPTTTPEDSGFAFQASIEQLSTKANMNAGYGLEWATGDKIGIGVSGWGDSQPFTLVGDGGSESGQFTWDFGAFDNTGAYAAFFPWQAQGGSYNSAWEGYVYFKQQGSYGNGADLDSTPYTSGKMLTPLVAAITRTGESYDPIQFKHAGAAVKVTINNLPAGAHSIGMTVADQQIYGNFKIEVANAGDDNMVVDGVENTSLNTIWLNYDALASEQPFTFIFPVPALADDSDLSFQIYDENGIVVWYGTASDQSAINHGEILVMPARTITPYTQFNAISSWYFRGTPNGWDCTPMVTDGSISIAKGITFAAGEAFKIDDGAWGTSYPAENKEVASAGTYDIIFNHSTHDITVVTSKCPYPNASGFGKGSDLSTPSDLSEGGAKDFGYYFE